MTHHTITYTVEVAFAKGLRAPRRPDHRLHGRRTYEIQKPATWEGYGEAIAAALERCEAMSHDPDCFVVRAEPEPNQTVKIKEAGR